MNVLRLIAVLSPIPVGMLLSAAAGLHKLQYGQGSYTHSPLVRILILLAAVQLLVLGAQPIIWLGLALSKQWRWLPGSLVAGAIGCGLLVLAVALDAATLLYAT